MTWTRSGALAVPLAVALATIGPAHQLEFGHRVHTYRVLEPLAELGDRASYVAYEPKAQRLIRLEILEAAGPGGLRRFRRGASALRGLDHPGIQGYLDSGMDKGHFFLATPFYRGRDLATILRQQGPVRPLMASRIAWKIAKALSHAHGEGVVLQGLTPRDVLITEARVVLVTGAFEAGADQAADLARLGRLFHHLLTGEAPAEGRELARPDDLEDAPAGLGEVLRRLTSRDPDQRYASTQEAVAALKRLAR